MTYQTLTDYNVTTLSGLFVYVANEVPYGIFVPMLLFSLFSIITLSVIYGQKRTGGDSNYFGAMAMASYVTFVVSIVMSLIPNLISIWTVLIVTTIAVIFTLLYLFSKDNTA